MLRRSLALFVAVSVVAGASAQIDPALLTGMKARAIGPAGMSGRIAAIEALPGDPALIYVGAATGGLWRSRNGGLTWTPVFDEQPVQSIGAIAIDGSNRDVVWVGTGEGNPRNSASVGNGVYRSLDGGETWLHLGLDGSEHIHRIALDPRDGDVACIAALGPLWGAGSDRGVFKTSDGGKTWRKVLYVDDGTGCADLVRDPRNPNKLFAAMWQHRRQPWTFTSGGPGSGLHVSWDGGETWQRLGPGDGLPEGDLGRIGIAIAPSEPDVVYALVEAKKNVLLRSDDGGKRFRVANDKTTVAPRPFYYCDVRVDPVRPDRVYSLHSLVTVSDDGGKTFRTLVPFRDVHPDHHALWIDPTDARRLLLGNDGGVAESRDRGETWRFVPNLPVGQFYHVDVDQDVPYHVYGGMQDNGSWRGPGDLWENGGIRNQHWEEVGFGDGFRTLPDPEDSLRGYSMSQGGALMRWDLRTGERKGIRPAPHDDTKLRFNWNAALAQDPFAPGTIYLGSQFVHCSRDRGDSWEVISPDLTTNNRDWQGQAASGGLTLDVTGAENFTTILAIAPSPLQQGVLWVGTDDGRVHVTRDGGRSWQSVEQALPDVPAHTWVPHIEPGRFDVATAFVVLDDHRRSNFATYVCKTTDFGRTWTSLAAPELRGHAHVIAQDLIDADLLFLGTEFGLWFTTDGGKAWHRFTHGIPAGVAVMGLALHAREHDLVVGTHGRAGFVIDDIRPLRELAGGALAKPLHAFASGPTWQHAVKQTGGSRFPGHGEFRGTTRPYGALVTFAIASDDLPHPDAKTERARKNAAPAADQPAEPQDPAAAKARAKAKAQATKATFEVRDGQGELIRTFSRPVHRGLNRVGWDLRRKGYKAPRRRDDERPREDEDDEPAGAEVAPGEYAVTVCFREHRATVPVTVLADPRVPIAAEARAAKAAALDRVGRLRGALAAALQRVQAVRADLDALDAKLDAERGADGRPAPDDPHRELRAKMQSLRAQLTALEKTIWTPEGSKGIPDDDHALGAVGDAMGALASSWHAPTPAELRYLEIGERRAKAALAQANALFGGDVAALRVLAAGNGLGLLAEQPPLEVK